MACMFLIGFFVAAIRPATAESIAKYSSSSDERILAFSLHYQALNVGTTIGPALGGLLASLSYVWVFRLDGMANLLASLAMYFCFRKKINTFAEKKNHTEHFVSPLKDKVFLYFVLLSLFIGIIFFQLFSMYPIFLKQNYAMSEWDIGFLMAVNGFTIILFQTIAVHFARRFKMLGIIAFGALLIGLGFAILPFYQGFYYAVFSMIIFTAREIITLPYMNDFVVLIAPEKNEEFILAFLAAYFRSPYSWLHG